MKAGPRETVKSQPKAASDKEKKVPPKRPQAKAPETTEIKAKTEPPETKKTTTEDAVPAAPVEKATRRKSSRLLLIAAGLLIVAGTVILLLFLKPQGRLGNDKKIKIPSIQKISVPTAKVETQKIQPAAIKITQPPPAPAKEPSPPLTQPAAPPAAQAALPGKKIDVYSKNRTFPNDSKILTVKTSAETLPSGAYPYSIHAGSYTSKKDAELYVENYRKLGLQAFWSRVDLGQKGVWFRVFIGCYKDLATARDIIKEKNLEDAQPVKATYANLVGSYPSEDALNKGSHALSEKGFSNYFIRDESGAYHLYSGAFFTMKGAEKHTAELNSAGFTARVVQR